MSSVIIETPPEPGIPPFPVRRFTVAEYEELARLGILDEDDNVELLEGWIAPKGPKNPRHDGTIDLLPYLLMRMLPLGWYVRVQNSVVTADSVPEPDLTVVRGEPGNYGGNHPRGPDVGLVIEVADSTVRRDRAKAAIYARAGIPHYWIVNLDDQQIEVFGQATGSGLKCVYSSREVLGSDASLPVVLDAAEIGVLSTDKILRS